MQEVTIDEKKNLSLEILQEIDTFCQKNNVRYFLQFGTLLGAIRHKGFIPWDDDIDISMPRPDYERFLQIFESERFEIANYRHKKFFPILFSKVSSKNTYGLYYNGVKLGYGVAVDIFPLDGLPASLIKSQKFYKKYCFVNKFYMKSIMTNCVKVDSRLKKIFNMVFKFVFNPRVMAYLLDGMARKRSYETSLYATSLLLSSKLRFIKKECYETIRGTFENLTTNIPKEYDIILRATYGDDYMVPPPESERKSVHDENYYWKEIESE